MRIENIRLVPLFLTVITFCVFFPTFFNDFQRGWDDQWQVLDYEFVTNHSLNNLIYHFTHFHVGQYFPVNTLLYIAVYEIFGFNPSAFHAACLLIHVCNVLLVYAVLRKVLGTAKPAWGYSRVSLFAGITALIFAVHPLQVESVAWISASKIVLYGFFFLLGLLFYLKYSDTHNVWWLAAVAGCYLLAFGSKEQAIIFPLNLIAVDYVTGRLKRSHFTLDGLTRRVILEKIPFLIIALLMYGFSALNNLGAIREGAYPFDQRMLFAMSSMMDYLFRFIAPVRLYYFYFYPIGPGEELPLYFWGYPILALICAGFLWKQVLRNNRLVVFGALVFLINIVLVLHIVPMPRKMITADRYMYFSIIGLGLITAWVVYFLFRKRERWRKILATGFTAWLLFLGVHSFYRTGEWKDSDAMKKNVNDLIEKRKARDQHIVEDPLNIELESHEKE